MKKNILLCAAFLFVSIACFSQDLMSLKRGTKVEVIVTEITPTLVRYRLFSDLNGQTYFVYKDDVVDIKYKDGRVDTFNSSNNQIEKTRDEVPKEKGRKKEQANQNKKQNQQSSSKVKNQKNVEVISQPANHTSQTNNFPSLDSKRKESDIVYLNNGSVIQGTIVEQIPNKSIKVQTKDGNLIDCQEDDVLKIVKEGGTFDINDNSHQRSSGLNSGYRGSIELGCYFGTGDYRIDRLNFHFINGMQINPYFSLGIGTGVYFFMNEYDDLEDGPFLIPIFADFRFNFINKPVSPYLSFDIGYSFNASDDFKGEGLLLNSSIGVSFKISRDRELYTGIGYQLQKVRGGYYYDSHIDSGAVAFKVGFAF